MKTEAIISRLKEIETEIGRLIADLGSTDDSDNTDDLLDGVLGPQLFEVIAVGQNYWEKRADVNAAIRAMKHRLSGGGMTPQKYKLAIYKVGPHTVVSDMGSFVYPKDGPKPELVRVVQVTKANGAVKDLPLEDSRAMR